MHNALSSVQPDVLSRAAQSAPASLQSSRARPDRAPSDALLWYALRRAGVAVCESEAADAPADSVTSCPWDTMDGIIESVLAVLDGGRAERDAAPRGPGARRLVRLLRQEIAMYLRSARTQVPASDVRRLLQALDVVEDDAASPQDEARPHAPLLPEVPENLAALAHDLRSPLTSVLFLVDSLRSGTAGPLTAAQQRQLNLVYVAAFGLCSVANDLLDAARDGTAGSGIMGGARPAPFSIAETLFGVRDIVLPIAEERDVALRLATPETDGRLGHPSALSRVLLNLVSNALRETQDGRVEIVVRDVGGDRVEYRVTDTGPGLEPAALARLFDARCSAPSRPRDALSSAGLGLAICRRLVEAMGGELRVESEPGRGTTFFFTLLQPAVSPGRGSMERTIPIGPGGPVHAYVPVPLGDA